MKKLILTTLTVLALSLSTPVLAKTKSTCTDSDNSTQYTIEVSNGHVWLENKYQMFPYGDSTKKGTVTKHTFINQNQTMALVVFVDSTQDEFQYAIVDQNGTVFSRGYCTKLQ